MQESLKLARFVSELKYEDLGADVIARAKDLILDQVGIMVGVSTMPWSRAIYDYVRDMGCGKAESTVVHYGFRTNAENAVFANSSFGHGFEIDDLYVPGASHPGCIVVPSALVMAEREGASGKDMILAVVAGYEVMGRINSAITPSCSFRGFHATTSVTGPFGAAAAAGKILGFDTDLMLNALSIAGSHSSGVSEYDQGGGTVKRMHAGMAAHGGLRSALIAKKGVTGPPTILEGKHGFCNAFADEYDLDQITDQLGKDFRVVLGASTKAYCACYGMHAGLDALNGLIAQHGIKAADVKSILMGTNRRSIEHVAAEPTDVTSAQFSAAFGLSLALIRGSNGFEDYTEQTLRDPQIMAMTKKVSMEIDKKIDSDFPRTRGARITVTLNSGERLSNQVDYCKGTPQNPMTRGEFEAKFRGLASVNADKARTDQIMTTVYGLDGQKDLSGLVSLLISH